MPYCGHCECSHDESNCTVARQIHDNGEAETSCQMNINNERENDKHLIKELKQLVKNVELNQEKFIADYTKDMRTLYTQIEKCDEEIEIMKINHSDHIATIVEKCAQKMEAMRNDMQNHPEKEMSIIQVNHNIMMKDRKLVRFLFRTYC